MNDIISIIDELTSECVCVGNVFVLAMCLCVFVGNVFVSLCWQSLEWKCKAQHKVMCM